MSSLVFDGQSTPQGLYTQSVGQLAPLGSTLRLGGRQYIYAKMGATVGVAGNIYQQPTLAATGGAIANHGGSGTALSVLTASIGDKVLNIVLGATAATENYYAEGTVYGTSGTGAGLCHTISGHAAVLSSGTMACSLKDPLEVALVASGTSLVALHPHKCSGVVIHPSPPTAALVGVAVLAQTAAYYGWFQTKGLCAVLTAGTVVVGNLVIASITVDGAVDPVSTTYAVTAYPIGRVANVRPTTEYSLIDLDIS